MAPSGRFVGHTTHTTSQSLYHTRAFLPLFGLLWYTRPIPVWSRIPFSLYFKENLMTSCTTPGHVKRLHELVWPSAWPHHGQIGQNHAGVAQLRNEGTRRPAVSAKNRDAELRMIPRKSSAAPVTFANSPRPCSYGHAMHDQPAGLTAVPRRQAARSASGSLQAQK